LKGISGGSRPPSSATGIAAHVRQYLNFTENQPFTEAIVDIKQIEGFIEHQQKIRENKPNTLQEKLRSLQAATEYIMHLLLPFEKKNRVIYILNIKRLVQCGMTYYNLFLTGT